MENNDERTRLLLALPVPIHRALKRRAKSERVTMTGLIIQLIKQELERGLDEGIKELELIDDTTPSISERIETIENKLNDLVNRIEELEQTRKIERAKQENPRAVEILERLKESAKESD